MNTALLHMLQVSDSVFPIGAFTLSNGLETFVQKDKLKNSVDLESYVANMLSFIPYNELGFFAQVYHTAFNDSGNVKQEELMDLDTLYSAYKSPFEVRRGSEKLCQRFLKVWEKIESLPSLVLYQQLIKEKKCMGHHAIALALFVKSKGISYEEGANIYAYSTISAIVTNAVKSVPLSQLDGQVVLHNLLPLLQKAVIEAKKVLRDELGVGGSGFDIYAMQHETLYSRIYMS